MRILSYNRQNCYKEHKKINNKRKSKDKPDFIKMKFICTKRLTLRKGKQRFLKHISESRLTVSIHKLYRSTKTNPNTQDDKRLKSNFIENLQRSINTRKDARFYYSSGKSKLTIY